MGNFERCMPVILKFEGGKADNPKDSGGRTNQGITQRVYNDYRRQKGMQQRDVFLMLDPERDDIYRSGYWQPIRGDELPDGIDLVVFDGAVNSGVVQSIKWLQRSLGVIDDGVLGPNTMHAVLAVQNKAALIGVMITKRETFLRALKTFRTFGNGWLSRTAQLRTIALSWVSAPVPTSDAPSPAIVVDDMQSAKASPADVKPAPAKGLGDMATGAGVGSGGLAVTVQNLQDNLTPYSMAGGWITKLVIALAIISAVLTIGGLAWRWYAIWKKKKLAEASA